MEGNINVAYLNEEEVDYELRIRKVRAVKKDLSSKRLILNNVLEKSKNVNSLELIDPDYEHKNEEQFVNKTLAEVTALIFDFSASKDDSMYKIISSRLTSLFNRVNRLPIPKGEREKLVTEFKDDSIASCLELEAKLELKLMPSNLSSTSIANVSQINKPVPVYKWQLQFDGTSSLKAFLERVAELAKARNVSENELFQSAIDLFTGKALLWYRSIRDHVNSWAGLVEQLEMSFLPPSYDDELLEEIKCRTQGRDESINIYAAVMQNLFNRLSTPLTYAEQLRIMRRNILPKYIDRLVLSDFRNVTELVQMCRKVDEGMLYKAKYTPPRNIGCLEPDLAYIETLNAESPERENYFRSDKNKRPSVAQLSSDNNSPNTSRVSNNVNNVICWNCRKTGHVFGNCKRQRSKFCFKCGKLNVTVRTCSFCNSKN